MRKEEQSCCLQKMPLTKANDLFFVKRYNRLTYVPYLFLSPSLYLYYYYFPSLTSSNPSLIPCHVVLREHLTLPIRDHAMQVSFEQRRLQWKKMSNTSASQSTQRSILLFLCHLEWRSSVSQYRYDRVIPHVHTCRSSSNHGKNPWLILSHKIKSHVGAP